MLDANILEQLITVFSALENEVTLVIHKSNHEYQNELENMVKSLSSSSDKILVRELTEESEIPLLTLEYRGKPTGISFKGVPGGHEFTSLVLAILNADGKGRMPDASILNRVKRLKGPAELRTYIHL